MRLAIKPFMIIIFLSLLLSAAASATVEITNEKVEFDVDYNFFNTETQKLITTNRQVNIINKGAENRTVILAFSDLPADYTTDGVGEVTLAAGETKTITSTIHVPHKRPSGKSTIGAIVIKDASTKTVLSSRSVSQNTKSMLSLVEVEIIYTDKDGRTQAKEFAADNEENDRFKLDNSIKPGTEVQMIFSIENLFDRDYDQDYAELDNVELNIEPDDKDLFVDRKFEEIYSFENLGAKKKDSKTIIFTTSEDVDPGDFTFEITLSGEDGKNINHEVKKELTITTERIRDDVRIISAEIMPEATTCEQNATLTVKVKNIGTNDQEFAGLFMYNQKLGISEKTAFELPRASKTTNTYEYKRVIAIPQTLAPGSYPLDISVFIKKDQQADSKILPFKVGSCAIKNPAAPLEKKDLNNKEETLQLPKTTTERKTEIMNPIEKNAKETTTTTSTIVKTIEDPYTSDDIVAGLLIFGIIIILAFITWCFVLLFKKE